MGTKEKVEAALARAREKRIKANTEWDNARAEWRHARDRWEAAIEKWEAATAKWEEAQAEWFETIDALSRKTTDRRNSRQNVVASWRKTHADRRTTEQDRRKAQASWKHGNIARRKADTEFQNEDAIPSTHKRHESDS